MKMTDILKKYVLPNLPYLIFLWFFAKVGEAVRLAPGVDASTKPPVLTLLQSCWGWRMALPWPFRLLCPARRLTGWLG